MELIERAEQLMRQAAAAADAGISRRQTLQRFCDLGHKARPEARRWAEAWQLLARAGFVCPEPTYPADGDRWFATPTGRASVGADFEGALRVALTSPV